MQLLASLLALAGVTRLQPFDPDDRAKAAAAQSALVAASDRRDSHSVTAA